MNTGVRHQVFLSGNGKEGAVSDTFLAGRATRGPCIEMSIKVDYLGRGGIIENPEERRQYEQIPDRRLCSGIAG